MKNHTALFDALESDLSYYNPSEEGRVVEWQTPRENAASALRTSLFKKYVEDGRPTDPQTSRATLDFLETLHRVSKWKLTLNTTLDEVLWGELRKEVNNFLEPGGAPLFERHDLLERLRPGPGASIGTRATDFYHKLNGPLTATSDVLFQWYRHATDRDPRWSHSESFRRTHHGSGDALVSGNKLGFVPKTSETARCICTEPLVNMLFQLSLGSFIEGRLRDLGLDIKSQPEINKRLAREGSLTTEWSTVDLKSASDSIGLGFLDAVLPTWFKRELDFSRSPSCTVPGLGAMDLPIVSTMGNGFTFPLQMMIFSCAIRAAYRTLDTPFHTHEGLNYGVFGDDIIIRKHAYSRLERLLSLCGFIINADKTFTEGHFRESCGGDYFWGAPVRGVYIKSLCTKQDVIIAINRLIDWSALTGIRVPTLISALAVGLGYVPFVPRWENADAGIRVPYKYVRGHLPKCKFTQSVLYQYYSVKRRRIGIDSDDPRTNVNLAIKAFLHGAIRDGGIVPRTNSTLYKLSTRVAPGWDTTNVGDDIADEDAWIASVDSNLFMG